MTDHQRSLSALLIKGIYYALIVSCVLLAGMLGLEYVITGKVNHVFVYGVIAASFAACHALLRWFVMRRAQAKKPSTQAIPLWPQS